MTMVVSHPIKPPTISQLMMLIDVPSSWREELSQRGQIREGPRVALSLTLPNSPSPYEVHDSQQNDGSEKRYDQARYAEVVLVNRRNPEQRAQEPTTEDRADDSDHDIEKDSLPCVGFHNHARNPADQSTDD
jgi:hypothetical protein